jgi:hypothetical protein
VSENNRVGSVIPDTLSPDNFEIGSIESRAAVRLLAQSANRAPHLIVHFEKSGPREDTGEMIGAPIVCDSMRATSSGVVYERCPDETAAEFERRVEDDLPIGGSPRQIIYWPSDPSESI